MASKKAVDYVKSEKAKGFSDGQLKKHLVRHDYPEWYAERLVRLAGERFDFDFKHSLHKKGRLFVALFYFLIALLSLQSIAGVALPLALSKLLPLRIVLPSAAVLIFGIAVFYMRKKSVYGTLMAAVLASPLGPVLTALISIWFLSASVFFGMPGLNPYFYAAVSVQSLLFGVLAVYMFGRLEQRKGSVEKTLFSAIAVSCVTVLTFAALSSFLFYLMAFPPQGVQINPEAFLAPAAAFALALAFFNAPYAFFFARSGMRRRKLLLLYLIPRGCFRGSAFNLRLPSFRPAPAGRGRAARVFQTAFWILEPVQLLFKVDDAAVSHQNAFASQNSFLPAGA